MSVADVVSKDILDVRRAKIIWAVAGLYTLVTAVFVYWGTQARPPEGWSGVYMALWNFVFVGAMFVPAIALVGAYLAIAGERESGSIKYLLSTPIQRRDVVLGKYVSRATVVAASLVVAFVVAAILSLVWFSEFPAGVFVGLALLTIAFALAYVAVAITISAATATRSRAMGGVLGFYFVTNLLILFGQLSILGALEYVLNELLGLGVGDDPIQLVGMLVSPTHTYLNTTLLAFPDGFEEAMLGGQTTATAWYVEPEAALVILLAWTVVPLALGVWRFERADLG
ncbi:ABC-2 type transporter [Halovivax asiaticus JCM 14624]|uniref:ABC-2 type transporter n=1 Tax=Halovivax asiaticus JCM 14624 TaxID=1227490 RepID=M0BEY7_9EURY|nr:ABC transporter permease subunit [Halovivax asiaticus]ELZ08214.1 ABC-2 type transporter [Halovivax asiaticus JCM 14624]